MNEDLALSIGVAAGKFALGSVGGLGQDWRRDQRLGLAYRLSADETIELCVEQGYPAGSDVWNSVARLLGSEDKARQVAGWFTQGLVSSELREMDEGNPIVSQFIQEFVVRLNDELADLLPRDLASAVNIISARIALLEQGRNNQRTSETIYWSGLPPSLGNQLFGREADLEALAADFEGHQAVVISGGAGTGKSRLAAEYAHRAGVDGFWTAAGVDAIQTLVALAPDLGLPLGEGSEAETSGAVQRRLAGLGPEVLWVVDNVHDIDLVNELAAAVGSTRLLVTTRDARGSLLAPTVAFRELAVLGTEPAIALLCSRRRPQSNWDPQDPSVNNTLGEISEVVGRLPLALEMLAGRLGVPRQTPDTILGQLTAPATPIELEAFKEAAGTAILRVEGVYATITGTLAELSAETRERISPLGYIADAPSSGSPDRARRTGARPADRGLPRSIRVHLG